MDRIERELRLRARELFAQRPDVRLYQAHPAFCFERALDRVPARLSDRALALRFGWLRLPRETREKQGTDFFSWLLRSLAAEHELAYEVWAPAGNPALLDALAPHATVVDRDEWGAQGPLTPAAIEALVEARFGATLIVERAGLLRFVARGGFHGAGVWLTAAELAELERELAWEPEGLRERVRPGHVLHRVHPAIGVLPVEGEHLDAIEDRVLGVAWLALPVEEQRRRERDLLAELLVWACEQGDGVPSEPGATDALMTPFDEQEEDDGDLDRVLITAGGHTVIESWEPRQTGVWVAPEDAAALQQRLMDAWWEPWQRRREEAGGAVSRSRDGGRVSRRTRAYVTLWASRVSTVVVCGGLLLADRMADWPWPVTLVLIAVAIALVLFVDSAARRWYERS